MVSVVNRVLVLTILFVLLSTIASAEVLVMNLNAVEYSTSESAKVFGYVLDDSLNAEVGTSVEVYLDDVLKDTLSTSTSGYFETYVSNFTAGNHTVIVNTSSSEQQLVFTAFQAAQVPSYKIVAPSLTIPYSSRLLNFTVKKYQGTTLTSDAYTYSVFYENGTLYNSTTGVSNVAELITLPAAVGLYTVVVDGKKSFTVSVAKFTLKFQIIDKAGNPKDIFKPNGIAYFKVEGFSNGQKISNATVTARVKNPTGIVKTVTFTTPSAGIYKGNTNVTSSGNPVQLTAGQYEVEFKMQDSSGNQQKVKGYFQVLGLDVKLTLSEKKPYAVGETAEFNVLVKKLADGSLITHNNTNYFYELEKDGKFYDVSGISVVESSQATLSSDLSFTIPSTLDDGNYFLKVKATSDGKSGSGVEYFEIRNTNMFVEMTDNFDGFRNKFQPGETAKIKVSSDANISMIVVTVEGKDGVVRSTQNKSIGDYSGYKSFTVPSKQDDYKANIRIITSDGSSYYETIWFSVQNYFSFMHIMNLNSEFQFILTSDESFLGEISVFDIGLGQGVDLTNFIVRFDRIINEETQQEYTNLQSSKNATYSDDATGRVVYNINPPALPNGFYRMEYTLVDSTGKSIKGEGWFGISAFEVNIATFNTNGQQKEVFSPSQSINVTVSLTTNANGTATMHREFFDELSFPITNGVGSVLLNSSNLPSQPGFYGFGVEVEDTDGDTGLGDGFFEIRNLNFRTINVQNNGEYAASENIVAAVTVEKSGSLVNQTNVSVVRLMRSRDGYVVPTAYSAPLTGNLGNTTLTINPTSDLEPGFYFVELKATKGSNSAFTSFGFQVVEDKVIITINDADKKFSTTDNIEVNVKVTYQNDTPKSGVTVNITGLLNFNTWATVSTTKTGTTASNGVATLTLSAANFNAAKYAPVVRVAGVTETIVGFGDGEFEIRPFTSTVAFRSGDESFEIDENILVNVTATGSLTVTAAVRDILGATQIVDYYYSNGVLTINNDLNPGEYFVDITIAQGSNSVTKTLWFEVLAPWAEIPPLNNHVFGASDTISYPYTIFIFGAAGWIPTNTTLNVTEIENLWTGEIINVTSGNFTTVTDANGDDTGSFDLTSYGLGTGDYLLHFTIPSNPDFESALYFRVESNVVFSVDRVVDENNVTFTVSTTNMDSPQYKLVDYFNFDNWLSTSVDQLQGSNVFSLNGLENGYYQAKIEIIDGSNHYFFDSYFDIRQRDVTIDAPSSANVGSTVQFNVSGASINTKFWVLDPFTQTALAQANIGPSYDTTNVTYTFNYGGWFVYSYGDTMWEAFPNGQEIEIIQQGFNVQWPWDNNRLILTGPTNFTFNVTDGANGADLILELNNFFEGYTRTVQLGQYSGGTDEFSFDLDGAELNLQNGPHDVKLIMDDGSDFPPTQFFFLDVFPDQFNMWAWTDMWEYQAGNTVNFNLEVYDVTNGWSRETPDAVVIERLDGPFGSADSSSFNFGGSFTATLSTTDFASGYYHAELNITEQGISRLVPSDFYVRGNDNLQLFWNQQNWDYSLNDQFALTVDVRDGSTPVEGIRASLAAFEKRPEDWNASPQNMMGSLNNAFYFSNSSNLTNQNGRITFYINLSDTSLQTGGYTGRLNVGGQVVWFDFSVRSYMVDAYTTQWEYGITDTIEVNVRARNIDTWAPYSDNGNVTIRKILKHEPGNWQPEEVSLTDFGLQTDTFEVVGGEALIEMQANSTALALSQPFEFELQLNMNLSSYGASEGWSWFRLSNNQRPSITIVDQTGETPESYFGDQTYTLQVSNVEGATLQNMWGPCGGLYGQALDNSSGTFELNFTTPNCPGWYDLEVQVEREGGFIEYMYQNFQIGSGTEMHAFMMGNVVPGVNFTVYMGLFGEGGSDPWCEADPFCQSSGNSWFGPLTDKTIILKEMVDLDDFSTIDLTGLNLSVQTAGFPSWMLPDTCQFYQFDEATCLSEGCMYENQSGMCMSDNQGGQQDQGEIAQPGDASFVINPSEIGMTAGKKYDLVFSYVDDESEETTSRVFTQVEEFHISTSKKSSNVGANSVQSVWMLATYLNGTPLDNCTIEFNAMYDKSNYQLVKTMVQINSTNENGSVVFQYTAPSLPGDYLIEGVAECNVSGIVKEQDIDFSINVGAKGLAVDMKTKFNREENVKLSITTKDRLGNPNSQRLEINLFHDKDDYPYPIYSLGGTDCTILDANQDWNHGGGFGGDQANNRIEITTDVNGNYELELCPLPNGPYALDVFPMFEFGAMQEGPMEGPKDENQFGFFANFIVRSADISMVADKLVYDVGETVYVNVSILDADGNVMNGTIIDGDALLENFASGNDVILWTPEENIPVVNGFATFNYTIPTEGPLEFNESLNVSVDFGPVDSFLMFEDGDGEYHLLDAMLHTIRGSNKSIVTAPSTIKSEQLLPIFVQTTSDADYKAEVIVFILQSNTDKEKMTFIDGGVFLEDQGDGTSSANFNVLAPKEPGEYYLAMMLYELGATSLSDVSASEVLIAPVQVTLDLVNVSGIVQETDGSPIANAKVKIGKIETTTNATGEFAFEIPKGTKAVEVEIINQSLTQFMKTDKYNFNANKYLNVSFYRTKLSGNLSKTFYNITSLTNIETETKLSMRVLAQNLDVKNFLNASITASAPSGKTLKNRNLSAGQSLNVTFNQLYAGFEDSTNELTIKLTASPVNWESSSYFLIDGSSVNVSVGAKLKKTYTVETYATAGDFIDNDGDCAGFTGGFMCAESGEWIDSCTDEEKNNNKDDDCDGKIDEDLEQFFIEGGFCGDGNCMFEEEGNCYEDCSGDVAICGDNFCDSGAGEDFWCPDDCGGSESSCTPWTCEDGSFAQGEWCNQWGVLTTDQFCDSCSWADSDYCGMSCNEFNCWACGTDNSSGSNECEQAGCTVGTEGVDSWCFYESTCSDNDCWACGTSGDCSGTNNCEWIVDPWAPNGGWCEVPQDCAVNCMACETTQDCSASTAWMTDFGGNNVSCAWFSDQYFTGCEWNMTHGGFEGREIWNVWLSSVNNSEDWNTFAGTIADFEGYSGNNGMSLDAGCYYIIIDLGNTGAEVSVNGSLQDTFNNAGGYGTQMFATSSCYTFQNGSYFIEVQDTVGPDYLPWEVQFGQVEAPQDYAELNIMATVLRNNDTHLEATIYLEDLSDLNSCDGVNPVSGDLLEWFLGVDSIPAAGCDAGGCWTDEDFAFGFSEDDAGTNEVTFEFWDGSMMDENLSATVSYDIDCSGNNVTFAAELADLALSCDDTVNVRFESWLDDGFEYTLESNTVQNGYTVTCGGPGPGPGANVSLSGYRLNDDGSELMGEWAGELCLENGFGENCLVLNNASYNFSNLPPSIYNITATLGDGWNVLTVQDYNLSVNTQMNFTLWDDTLVIMLTDPNLEFVINEEVLLNLTVNDSMNDYADMSLYVEFEQSGDTKIYDQTVYNANFDVTAFTGVTFDGGTYNTSSDAFSLGLVDVFVGMWNISNEHVMTDIAGSISARNALEFIFQNITISGPSCSGTINCGLIDEVNACNYANGATGGACVWGGSSCDNNGVCADIDNPSACGLGIGCTWG